MIYLYITINLVNLKYYVGIHKETIDKKDNYLGCGIFSNKASSYASGDAPLKKAVLKYGANNFVRINLMSFDSYEEALEAEKIFVDQEFIKSNRSYNATIGGGLPPNNHKYIYQFDLNGTLLKKWYSAQELRRTFNCHVSFHDIIMNKRSYAGYFWSYDTSINPEEHRINLRYGYINRYDLNGNLIKKYKSISDAANELGISREKISMSIFRKTKLLNSFFIKADMDVSIILNKYK